jgi:hypothetical protein
MMEDESAILYKKLTEIRNKLTTFEKEIIKAKLDKFIELKKEENKILLELIEYNKTLVDKTKTKETNLDIWTYLHTPSSM